jgi:hypothetical protein
MDSVFCIWCLVGQWTRFQCVKTCGMLINGLLLRPAFGRHSSYVFSEVAGKILYDRHSYRSSCFCHDVVKNSYVHVVIFFSCVVHLTCMCFCSKDNEAKWRLKATTIDRFVSHDRLFHWLLPRGVALDHTVSRLSCISHKQPSDSY